MKTTKKTTEIKAVVPEKSILKVQKLLDTVSIPTTHYEKDAGLDLSAAHKMVVAGQTTKVIGTGLAFQIPEGYFGKVFDRSGMAANSNLIVKAGVIDSDYTGEIRVIMSNTSPYPETILPGDRIAQLVVLPLPQMEIKEVSSLDDTKRGTKGLGSTGK